MRLRLAAILSITLACMGVLVAPANSDPLPTISIGAASWDEPIYPATSSTVTFTVTLSQPSAADVTVGYELPGSDVGCCPNPFAIATAGTLTIPAGDVTGTIPVTILDDGYGANGVFRMYLMNPTGATLASSTYESLWSYPTTTSGYMEWATGTIINHDRLGDFFCEATGVGEAVYTYRPNTGRPSWGPTNQEVDARVFSSPCSAQNHSTGATTQTVPATSTTPAITLTMGPEALTNDGNTPPAPDYRPTLGNFADARASLSAVTISVGLTTVVVQGLQAHVRESCDALGGLPSTAADSAVGRVIVNGVPLPVVPTTLDLGTVKILFDRDVTSPSTHTRSAMEITAGDVTPYDYPNAVNAGIDLTFATATIATSVGSPCMD